mgnify:CR=1 FL=1
MTMNSELVLNYLKKNFGKEMTKNEIAEALSISVPAVTGSVNGLVKKGYAVERIEEVEVEPATETRKAKIKNVRHVQVAKNSLRALTDFEASICMTAEQILRNKKAMSEAESTIVQLSRLLKKQVMA